jgi:2-oxoglutarate ferredoxin oxidoreductase subunit delta
MIERWPPSGGHLPARDLTRHQVRASQPWRHGARDGGISCTRAKDMSEQKKVFTHVIRERWCKGCGICVAYCPKKVLGLRDAKVVAERPEDCIGCKACELRCPDFAIEIHEAGAEAKGNHSEPDYALPPEAHHA